MCPGLGGGTSHDWQKRWITRGQQPHFDFFLKEGRCPALARGEGPPISAKPGNMIGWGFGGLDRTQASYQ